MNSRVDAPASPHADPTSDRSARDQRRAERQIAREVQVWLAHQEMPKDALIWYLHWHGGSPIELPNVARLSQLIARLDADDFGGVSRHNDAGPWAQVKHIEDGELLVELHPRAHGDEPGGMYFERVIVVSAAAAGALIWAWVRRADLPIGYLLEPRVIPPGRSFDVAL